MILQSCQATSLYWLNVYCFSHDSSFFPTKIILIVETMNSLLSVIEYIYHRINNNLQTEAIYVVNKQLSTVLPV